MSESSTSTYADLPARYHEVYRPLGVTIAIVATAAFYGLMPLLEVYILRRLDATADEAFIMGGVAINTYTYLQGAIGALILVLCVWAWIGRPPWTRHLLIAGLLIPTLITLARVFEAWTQPVDPISGGQAQELVQNYLRCQVPLLIVVPLYVLWYLNRAPARAFYRRVSLVDLMRAEDARSERVNDTHAKGN